MKKVNDYDKYAAERQERLKKGEKLSHKYVEKPMMSDMLPSLSDKKVLMVGCGTGEETKLLEKSGVKSLTGIDISPESIKLANETYPNHSFEVGDMHHIEFPDNTFDFAYSSVTIHYSAEPLKVLREIYRILDKDGQILFSVGHPLRWSAETINIYGTPTSVLGYAIDKTKPRVYGTYNSYTQHEANFISGEALQFWVGAPSFYYQLLKEAGFVVDDFQESKAIKSCEAVNSYYYQKYSELPQFMAFLATKK